jgi:adenylate cyclase
MAGHADRSRASTRLSKRGAWSVAAIGLAVSVLVGIAGIQQPRAVTAVDKGLFDAYLRYSASDKPSRDTIVVDIDDVSLSAVGQWPWPRYRLASLIQRIAAQRPAAIGLDILLPEPDRSSLVNIQKTFKRDFGVDVAFSGVPSGLLDNDGYLGHEIAEAGAVGANYFYFDHVNTGAVSFNAGLSFTGRTDLLALPAASGALLNAQTIASQTRVTGFVNNQFDDDGVLRRLPLLIAHGGVTYANLSLATVMRSMGIASGSIDADRDGPFVRVGPHRIPIDESGFATVRFNGNARSYAAVSAVDILNGTFHKADLAGKIVFVGSSAVGLNDVHDTAVDSRFPGLKVQAAMAENIVNDDFVRTPQWASMATFVACIAVGVVMSVLFIATSGVYIEILGSVLVVSMLILASVVPFVRAGLFVSPGTPIIVVITLFGFFFVSRFAIEKRRAHMWQRQLENARQVTIESMASVAETRDPETGAHIKRTQHYVKAIAERLWRSSAHADLLTTEYIDLLFLSAPLHDIGKVGVPDHILLKPGRLSPEEFELMKQHAEFGRKIIFGTAQQIEGDNFLVLAGEIAATHHEKWDGTGYPLGLGGQDIPLSGRIMAVADIYDALISRRCYKEPFPHQRATDLMREGRGTTFDPEVLDAFFEIEDEIMAIGARYSDAAKEAAAVEPSKDPVAAPAPATAPPIGYTAD